MSLSITLYGKTILVTGGGNGIGRALCKKLHAQGAKVYALDLKEESLKSLAAECPGLRTICTNLEDWEASRKAVAEVGPVDGLVNSAGIAIDESFFKVTSGNFDKLMNINVKAMINVSQVVAQGMIDAGIHGSIVNISSLASRCGTRRSTVYNLSKAAVDMLTKSMAVELGQHKIRVNSFNPIFILTDISRPYFESEGGDKVLQYIVSRVPMGRIGELDEAVNSILFLLSDAAPMVNATNLFMDGGFSAS
jgi:NAD(P)-dependent dehydrogenase (short-subunit alcohol dehydrogenase family)